VKSDHPHALQRLLVILVLALCASLPGGAHAQAAPEGLWRTISDTDGRPRALVRLQMSVGVLTGTAEGSLVPGENPEAVCIKCPGELRNKPLRGMRILWGLKQSARNPRVFEGGRVLDPDSGRIYNAKVTLAPDNASLTMRGFLGIETVGRSQTWLRHQ
jgi:uncharacterized protein (DUF2147 family)